MNLVFARHGESEFSVRGALNGDTTVPVGLTIAGLGQAKALGEALADQMFDLCVTTEFQRTRETADAALGERDVPRIVIPELNDPLYGPFEGGEIEAYRSWAEHAPSRVSPGPGGESRYALVERYARGFRLLLERPEESILVVAHSLPIAYVLAARDGTPPASRMPLVTYATPYALTGQELRRAAIALEYWLAVPSW
ncbi:MAG TPA: histidine phosphatase family protein [Gaiellaceae bacterium]|nr:histidine phosphatase family protein [Gaiellaceae bacterium]